MLVERRNYKSKPGIDKPLKKLLWSSVTQ